MIPALIPTVHDRTKAPAFPLWYYYYHRSEKPTLPDSIRQSSSRPAGLNPQSVPGCSANPPVEPERASGISTLRRTWWPPGSKPCGAAPSDPASFAPAPSHCLPRTTRSKIIFASFSWFNLDPNRAICQGRLPAWKWPGASLRVRRMNPTVHLTQIPVNLTLLPVHLPRLPSSISRLATHLARLPANLTCLTIDMARLPARLGCLPIHLVRLPAYMTRLTSRMARLPVNTACLPGRMGRLPTNMARLPGHLACLPTNMEQKKPCF